MGLQLYSDLEALVRKGHKGLTEEDAMRAVSVIRDDQRVLHLNFEGLDDTGRYVVNIHAVDVARGVLKGTMSIVNAIQHLSFTSEEYFLENEKQAVFAEENDRLWAERKAKRERDAPLKIPPTAFERQDNLLRLKAAGISPYELVRYVNSLSAGRYISDEDPAHESFGWYSREIVRRRVRPMDLKRYLANFI